MGGWPTLFERSDEAVEFDPDKTKRPALSAGRLFFLAQA
jgi:hypothetical protein